MKKYLLGFLVLVFIFSVGFGFKKALASTAEELTITKICSPVSCASTGDSFSFILNDSNGIIGSSFTLNSNNNYTKTFPNFQNSQMSITQQLTNIYTIIESTPSGWDAPSISCTPTNVLTPNTLSYASNSVTFDYTPNPMVPLAHITCAFTNTKQAVVEKDLCSNIEGVQSTVPAGYTIDARGSCTQIVVEKDLCSNIEGVQSTVPAGYTIDARGNCTQIVVETDLCKNIEGNQATVPTGYTLDATTGQCNPIEKPRIATLNIQSIPAGVTMVSQTCYTISSGTCGKTNWTSTNAGNIPSTIYKYPITATISGTSYTLDSASLTGCNLGTAGSPVDVCNVSVAVGTTATISATYKITPPPIPPSCTTGVPSLDWTQATSSANWSKRSDFTTVVFNNKMWVMGGTEASASKHDVWSSSDGTTWTQITASAPWSGRWAHSSLVFNNKLWVIGGQGSTFKNDVWSSSDGVTWTQTTASAPWSGRSYLTAVVFNNKMWVMGGANYNNGIYKNDVWSSSDGVTWTQITASAPWTARWAHSSVVFNNKIWVMGGEDNNNNRLHDVWSSSDGITWTQTTAASGWSRSIFGAVVFNNKIWVMGGANQNYYHDVWSSSDGITWTKETALANWTSRASFGSPLIFNNRIWIMGGGSYQGLLHDVWCKGVNDTSLPTLETPALEKKPGFFVRTWNWVASPFVYSWKWFTGLFGAGDTTGEDADSPTSTDERLAKLNVESNPIGINLISPTCFTVSSGICGTTNWTSTKSGGIPTTTYKYPTTSTVGTVNYILDSNSLTGCNQGTGGSPANECNVSVTSGTTATISAIYKKAPPLPVPTCEVGTANLVANPSFDLVKLDSGINIGGTRTWWYISTQSTTNVINWTRDQSAEPVVTNWIQSTPNRLPFDGSKFLLLNPLGFGPFGVRGHLTTTPQIGVPYVLSARIQSVFWPVAGTVTMRLRNSGTGAQSDPVTGTAIPQTNNWVLIGGTITPTAYYNQVILRYSQDGGMGLIDDVRLCKASSSNIKKK